MGACNKCCAKSADCCGTFGCFARVLALLLTAVGIALQILATLACEFLTFNAAFLGNSGGTIGLFEYSIGNDSCTDIPDDRVDGYLKASRACILLSIIFAAVAFVAILFEFLTCRIPCWGCAASCIYTCALISGGLAYLIYGTDFCSLKNSNADCNMSDGGWMNVGALVFYLIASIIACCFPKPEGAIQKAAHAGHEEMQQQEVDHAADADAAADDKA